MKFKRISGLLITFALIAPVTLTGCFERDVVIEEQEEDVPIIAPEPDSESDININQTYPGSDMNEGAGNQDEMNMMNNESSME